MPSKWYYEKGGVRKGPVTSEDIRRMVANGTLLPTDLLWKEGMKDWMPAGKSSKLFSAPPQVIADPKSGVATAPTITTSRRLTQAGSESAQRTFKAVAGGLKGAGSLVQKQAYRTKLVQVDLPRAHADLGEAIYSKRLQPQILAPDYERIFALTQQLSDLLQSHASLPTPDGFGTRAKRLVEDANALARRKVLETQISRAKATLGETAFAQGLDLPGCENQLEAVSKLKATLNDADEAITAISSSREFSSVFTPGRILASVAVVSVALVAWAGLSRLTRLGAIPEGETIAPAALGQTSTSGRSNAARAARPEGAQEVVKEFYKTGELLSETPKIAGRVHGPMREYHRDGGLKRETLFENNIATRTTFYRKNGDVYLDIDLQSRLPAEDYVARTQREIDLSVGPDGEPVKTMDNDPKYQGGSGRTWQMSTKTREYDDDPDFPGLHGLTEWSIKGGQRISQALWDPDLMNRGIFWKFEGNGKAHYLAGYPHGLLELTYPDGSTMLTMHFVGGVRHGLATSYHSATDGGVGPAIPGRKGHKRTEVNYVGGMPTGTWRWWHANGQLALEGELVGGDPHGKSRQWYDNGQMKTEEVYVNNQRNGPFTWWWPNGNVKAKGVYLNDQLDGNYTAWNESGAIEEQVDYVNGSPKASKVFEDLVSEKKREGFQMVATANPRGDSRYKFAGCQVGYRSRGNQDDVIAIVALNPLPKDMIGDGEAGAGVMITNYGQVMGLKGMFVAVLTDAVSRVFREQMMYMRLPGGQQIFKDTTNGRTSFTGVLVVGNEVCTFEIPAENRRVLDNDRAFVRCGGQVITLGLSNGPEMDPRKWSAARKVLSGGRSN